MSRLDVLTGAYTACASCGQDGIAVVRLAWARPVVGPAQTEVGLCEDCTTRLWRFWQARAHVLGQVLDPGTRRLF